MQIKPCLTHLPPVGRLGVTERGILNSNRSNHVINKMIKLIAEYSVKWPAESATIAGEWHHQHHLHYSLCRSCSPALSPGGRNCCRGPAQALAHTSLWQGAEMGLGPCNTQTFFICHWLAEYEFLWPNNKLSSNKPAWMACEIWLMLKSILYIFRFS